MASKFKITTKGVTVTAKRLRERQTKLRQLNIPVAKTLIVWFAWIQRNFKAEGGNVGGWKPLAEATKARRKRRNKRAGIFKILQETGTLRQSWAFLTPRKGKGVLKSFKQYSKIHDRGGIGPKGQRIPQRRILPTNRQATQMAMKVFTGHVRVSIK